MSIDLAGVLAGVTKVQFATLPQWKVFLNDYVITIFQQNRSFIDLLASLAKSSHH